MNSRNIHETFDFNSWSDRLGSDWSRFGWEQPGPIFEYLAHQRRRLSEIGVREYSRVPTDYFVLGLGESPDRRGTKIGGLPYWPRGRSWPVGPEGASFTFVAQISFLDSKDLITKPLPGDILLLFGEQEQMWYEPGAWSAVAWVSASFSDDQLVNNMDLPETGWTITPCYGVRHRTEDWVLKSSPADVEQVRTHRGVNSGWPESEFVLHGTKIGGVPLWMEQSFPGLEHGTYVCTLGETIRDQGARNPFVNQDASFSIETIRNYHPIRWGGLGLAYFALEDDGTTTWHAQWD